MTCIQATFSKVIELGWYTEFPMSSGESTFMCNALDNAYLASDITLSSKDKAKDEIDCYLDAVGRSALAPALRQAGLDDSFEARLAIFKAWANRPSLTLPSFDYVTES